MVLKLIREYDNSKKINEIIDFYFKWLKMLSI
jgi:hypothetical protein